MAREVTHVTLNAYEFDIGSADVNIKCICDGGPCPMGAVTWFHDGEPFDDIIAVKDDRIMLFGGSKSVHGKYECKVDNRSSPPAVVKTGCKSLAI